MRNLTFPLLLTLAMTCANARTLRAAEEAPAAPPVVPIAPIEAPPVANAQPDPDPAEVAADALVVRPVGVAATVVGAAIYVVALPFAAIAGDIHTPARSLVGAPARFTFQRRLGDFRSR